MIARIDPSFRRDYDASTSDERKTDRRMLDICDDREASGEHRSTAKYYGL